MLLIRQDLAVSLVQFIDLLNEFFLGAIFCRVLAPIFVQKGSIYCKSRIWNLGYTQGNVDSKKLDLGHVRKSLGVIIRDLMKAAPETLLDTNIGMVTHFVVLPNCFIQGW